MTFVQRLVLVAVLTLAVPACGGGVRCGAAARSDEERGTIEGRIVEASEECVTVHAPGAPESASYVNGATDQVPVEHLLEHRASREPVLLSYEVRDGERVAYQIDDAPVPSPSPASEPSPDAEAPALESSPDSEVPAPEFSPG